MAMSEQDQELVDAAGKARQSAYAPYSGFPVGAAVRLKDGRVFTGVNVENSSYGLTVCAERNSIAAAVCSGAKAGDVIAWAVVAEAHNQPASPCGACRQVLAEFATDEALALLHNLKDGTTERHTLSELLPHAFKASDIPNT